MGTIRRLRQNAVLTIDAAALFPERCKYAASRDRITKKKPPAMTGASAC